MSKISEKVLGDIRKNGVRPTCRLYFVGREIAYWVFYMLIMISGSFIFAGILELLFGRDLNLLSAEIILKRLSTDVPTHWPLVLILVLFAGLYVNRRTKKSYRYKKRIILSGEMLVVSLFGIVLYFLEAGILTCDLLGR